MEFKTHLESIKDVNREAYKNCIIPLFLSYQRKQVLFFYCETISKAA